MSSPSSDSLPSNTIWYSWAKFDGGLGVNSNDLEHHLRALGWAVAMILFSFIVLAFDTRQPTGPPRRTYELRDRILGIEQRYFLALFNGFVLYGALVFLLERNG